MVGIFDLYIPYQLEDIELGIMMIYRQHADLRLQAV
jgi:hypothetical protein